MLPEQLLEVDGIVERRFELKQVAPVHMDAELRHLLEAVYPGLNPEYDFEVLRQETRPAKDSRPMKRCICSKQSKTRFHIAPRRGTNRREMLIGSSCIAKFRSERMVREVNRIEREAECKCLLLKWNGAK